MSRTFGVDDSARAAERHELLLDALEVHNETLERSLGGNEAKKLAAAFIQIEGNLRELRRVVAKVRPERLDPERVEKAESTVVSRMVGTIADLAGDQCLKREAKALEMQHSIRRPRRRRL